MAKRQQSKESEEQRQSTFTIARRARHWEVRDPAGDLVCLTVYKRGAQEVIRRLTLGPVLGMEPPRAHL